MRTVLWSPDLSDCMNCQKKKKSIFFPKILHISQLRQPLIFKMYKSVPDIIPLKLIVMILLSEAKTVENMLCLFQHLHACNIPG